MCALSVPLHFLPRQEEAFAYALQNPDDGSGYNFETISTDDIGENIEMKQEPEDEEDCYFDDESSMPAPSGSPTSVPPLLPPQSSSSSSSSPGRHGIVTHRVRSHARSLRAMANPSAVWAHFDLCANDPLRAQCRICSAVVVRGGANPRQCGTTNLHRHLRVHHGGRLIGRRYHGKGPSSALVISIRDFNCSAHSSARFRGTGFVRDRRSCCSVERIVDSVNLQETFHVLETSLEGSCCLE